MHEILVLWTQTSRLDNGGMIYAIKSQVHIYIIYIEYMKYW